MRNSSLEFKISNASVNVVELGWQELEIIHKGKPHIIELESEEWPSDHNGINISFNFRDKESKKIAKKIGFELTPEIVSELQQAWDSYSNINFRS